jgi:hypothetical protein
MKSSPSKVVIVAVLGTATTVSLLFLPMLLLFGMHLNFYLVPLLLPCC